DREPFRRSERRNKALDHSSGLRPFRAAEAFEPASASGDSRPSPFDRWIGAVVTRLVAELSFSGAVAARAITSIAAPFLELAFAGEPACDSAELLVASTRFSARAVSRPPGAQRVRLASDPSAIAFAYVRHT